MSKLLQPGTRVAIFGDSHMEALGPRLRAALESAGITVTNVVARRGWSLRGYVASGDIASIVQGADVVIVELGGNDAAQRIDSMRHGADVEAALRQVGGRKVIWIGPGVTLREDLERYRGPIRAAQHVVLDREGHVWVDSQSLTRESDLRDDGVHFSSAGYDRWAEALMPELMKAGESSTWWIGPVAAGGGALFALGAYLWYRR